MRASERAAALACFTMSSSSFRLCEPGCSSRKARSSRSGLLNLGSGPLAGGGEFHAQAVGGRAQRIALRLHLFGDDEALCAPARGSPCRPAAWIWRDTTAESGRFSSMRRICSDADRPGRNRGAVGAPHRARHRSASRSCRGGFPRRGAACRAARRRAASSNSRRSSGPAPCSSALSTGSLSIRRSASRAATAGGSSWQRRMTPVSLRVPKGTIRRLPDAHAMAQRLGQRIGERLIERHRQTDVAVEVGSLGHGRVAGESACPTKLADNLGFDDGYSD